MLVDAWLPRAAAADPQRLAVNGLTFSQLLAAARIAARQLSALGVRAGDRVAIVLPAGEQFAIALHATFLLGAVVLPIDPNGAPAELAERSAGAAVVIDRPLSGHEDPAATLMTTHNLSSPAVVLYSSASSGQATEVELSYGNFWWSAAGSAVALGLDQDERWLCCLPVSHVGGLSILIRSSIYATSAVALPSFDTEQVLHQLTSVDGPTLISLVPTTLQRLLDAGLSAPPSLRYALLGGAPISDSLRERAASVSVNLAPSYGMTEACSQVVTSGAPLFCTRVELDEGGEVLVSGPTVAGAFQPQLATGDLGSWHADGSLQVIGRLSSIIISGGENVSPETVEAALLTHPQIAEAAVVGRPDPQWGEVVAAFVVPVAGSQLDPNELRAFVEPLLSAAQRPKSIELRSELPKTASGKLARGEL